MKKKVLLILSIVCVVNTCVGQNTAIENKKSVGFKFNFSVGSIKSRNVNKYLYKYTNDNLTSDVNGQSMEFTYLVKEIQIMFGIYYGNLYTDKLTINKPKVDYYSNRYGISLSKCFQIKKVYINAPRISFGFSNENLNYNDYHNNNVSLDSLFGSSVRIFDITSIEKNIGIGSSAFYRTKLLNKIGVSNFDIGIDYTKSLNLANSNWKVKNSQVVVYMPREPLNPEIFSIIIHINI